MTDVRRVPVWVLLALALASPRPDPVAQPIAPADLGAPIASSAPPAPAALAAAPAAETPDLTPYVDGEWLVAPRAGDTLAGIARRAGAEVVEDVGRSGYGVVRIDDPSRLVAVGAAPAPLGRIVGTGKPLSKLGSALQSTTQTVTLPPPPPPWHLTELGLVPSSDPAGWAAYTVAVLDSGVAYETYDRFVRAPGLSAVPFVAPLDLVEGDGHPNDDHQHGTHIASLIASRSSYPGVVPGVTVMPIKVLDHTNSGTEWGLIEGLYHAIDNGADVINLSLSFPLGYVPSEALEEALAEAWHADVVVVGAAGNAGAFELTWPAASRTVISVGATTVPLFGILPMEAPYTGRSPALDILAPGGLVGSDGNLDGWPDGVLAETIDPLDPARTGFWFYQGTSQATALISGVAVRLLAAGVAPHDVGPTLQQSRGGFSATDAWIAGTGADSAYLPGALENRAAHRDVYVGVLPFVKDVGGASGPAAQVTAIDGDGAPIVGATVLGTQYAVGSVRWPKCTTGGDGTCVLQATASSSSADAWAFRVEAVVVDGVAQRPARAVWPSDVIDATIAALEASGVSWDAFGVYWPAGADPGLGLLREAWALMDVSSGDTGRPFAVVMLPSHLDGLGTTETVWLDLDGTGLMSSPMGTPTQVTRTTLGGSGLLSSPFGTGSTSFVSLRGTGLMSSPMTGSLGYHPAQTWAPTGTGLMSSPMGTGGAIRLDRGTLAGSGSDSAEATFDPYGGRTADGQSAVESLVGSGAIDVGTGVAESIALPASTAVSREWK